MAGSNFGEFIGVSDLHYALIGKDDLTAYQADTPVYLAPAASVANAPNVAVKNRFYDNKAYYTTSTEGETKVTVIISGIDLETKYKLLGKHYDSTAKRGYDTGDSSEAPYVALGFRMDVEGGARYFWYLKGKFAPYAEDAETKTTDITEKTTTLEFTAIVTTYSKFQVNGKPVAMKKTEADTRLDPDVTSETWFAKVQTPALAAS